MKYCALAEPITAKDALQDGLVYKVVTEEDFNQEVQNLAVSLAQGPYTSYKMLKKQVNAAIFNDYREFLKQSERSAQLTCAGTEDFKEGIEAFIKKRKPDFKGE
ncbi:MAG: enoyl-CoA hydratase-related protein [Eubacterium sp.]